MTEETDCCTSPYPPTNMTQTAYPVTIGHVVITPGMNLTLEEEKLILRVRQERRKGNRLQFILDPLRMTLIPIDTTEIEELGRA